MLTGTRSFHAVLGMVAAIALLVPGGNANAAEIGEGPQGIDGIPGSYVRYDWYVPAGELVAFTFAGERDEIGWYRGTCARKVKRTCFGYGCDTVTSQCGAASGNPANGWGSLAFWNGEENLLDHYWIMEWHWNLFSGNIQRMKLVKVDLETGAYDPDKGFWVYRLGL